MKIRRLNKRTGWRIIATGRSSYSTRDSVVISAVDKLNKVLHEVELGLDEVEVLASIVVRMREAQAEYDLWVNKKQVEWHRAHGNGGDPSSPLQPPLPRNPHPVAAVSKSDVEGVAQ